MQLSFFGLFLTAVMLAFLLLSEWRGFRVGIWIFKPLASIGFLFTAWSAGALESFYGSVVFLALVLCFLGDVLLIPKSKKTFLLGVGSFLLGHLTYIFAFSLGGWDLWRALPAAIILGANAYLVSKWLLPYISKDMKNSILAYIVVISVMVVSALSAQVLPMGHWAVPAILVFYFSDLAVARNRFLERSFINKAWGLPFYYVAQSILALSVQAAV
jgi:uncharacterized membrane protein YhhN